MGEVYRARDTRLNRDVAIKCLHHDLSGDPSSRQRIEREARATASVSHPNICTLFDVGHHGDEMFLVMELLDGETLSERLSRAKHGLPLADVLGISTQLADALAVAHRHGLMHRDIKPGNIMITSSGAKLLDFGLARPSNAAGDDTRSSITLPNERLGTPAYMAPEQLTGAADHRSDIYATGAVIYEMLTGAKALTSTGAPIAIRPDTPAALDRLVRKCLDKDPSRRWQSAADLADELRWIATPEPVARDRRTTPWLMIAAVVAIGAIAAAVIAMPRLMDRNRASVPERWSFLVPPKVTLPAYGPGVAISPDASMVAFAGATNGGEGLRLFVKRLDAPEARAVAGTEQAQFPFFSPDSKWVGFFNRGHVMKWSVATDGVTTVADLVERSDPGSPASWSADDVLLFGRTGDQPQDGIREVAASGGESPRSLTRPDNAQREQMHFAPQRLPGGQIMFTIRSVGPKGVEFRVAVRNSSAAITTLIPGAALATYLDDNQLLYQAGSTLTLADFDPSTLKLSNMRSVVDDVYVTTNGAAWAVAGDTLVYRPTEPARRRLVWVDGSGQITPLGFEPRDFANPSISPAGDRAAVAIQQPGALTDIWVLDLPKQTLAPLTTDAVSGAPVWNADGTQIAMSRTNGASRDVVIQSADGSTPARTLLNTGGQNFVAALDAHSRLMVVMTPAANNGRDISVMDRDDPSALRPIVQTPAVEYGGRISPNGKWLSYFSDASGRMELYVTPFPNGGPKWQLSRTGAREAVWSRDGRELYFRLRDAMYAIAVHDSGTFSWDPPRELFKGAFFLQGGPGNVHYDVAADGRFLMIEEAPARSQSFSVVRHWRALVK